jgi:PAS domain S-box-containing protein
MEPSLMNNADQSALSEKMLDLAARIAATPRPDTLLDLLNTHLPAIVPHRALDLYTLDESRLILVALKSVATQNGSTTHEGQDIPVTKGLIGTIFKNGIAEMVNDAHLDNRRTQPGTIGIHGEHNLVYPLVMGQNTSGVLVLTRSGDDRFSPEEFERARLIAAYTALALAHIGLTDTLRVQQELRQAEAIKRAVVDTLTDGIVSVGSQGNILLINEPTEKIFGYHRGELSGKPLEMLIPDYLKEVHKAAFDNYNRTGKRHLHSWTALELIGRHKLGHEIPLEISFGEARVDENKIFTGIIRDITQRKKAEKELQDISMRLTGLIQTSHTAIMVEDEHRKVALCNETFCRLFDLPELPEMLKDADGAHILDRCSLAFVEDQRAFQQLMQRLPTQKTEVVRKALKLSNGKTIECDYIPIFVGTEYRGHMWLFRDITEQKRALKHMKKLARLTKENPNPIVRMNREFMLVDANNTAMEFIKNVLKGKLPDEWRRVGEQSFQTGDIMDMEFYHPPSDRYYLAHIVPDKARKYINVYGREITELKHTQKDLIQAKLEAEQSVRTKEIFLANMSHELRTPINGVLGLTNLLMTGDSPMRMEYLNGIRASGQQLLSVINDILDLSKIEAGMLRFEQTQFNPQKIIINLISTFNVLAEQKGIKLHVDSALKGTEVLLGDSVRLNQIILNLISNAIKFTETGSITLAASLEQMPGGTVLQFSVTDTGIGIAPEKLDQIFEGFVQAEDDVTRKYGGTGLGLTIVRQLVDLQGGTLRLRSTLGSGSTFSFTIPYTLVGQTSTPTETDTNSWTALSSLENFHVLIAEDNFINQVVARQTLEHWKIKTTVVSNGKEVLLALREKKFDLILMDVQMPEMDGMTATRKIREEFSEPLSNIPIIAMTASVLDEPERRVMDGGMNDYISKPFKPQDLHQKLTQWLGKTVQLHTMITKHVHLDMVQLNDVFEDPASLASFLESAQESLEQYVQSLKTLHSTDKRALYEMELHRVKGSLGALGATSCFNEAVTLERQLKTPGNSAWPDHTTFISMVERLIEEIRVQCTQF